MMPISIRPMPLMIAPQNKMERGVPVAVEHAGNDARRCNDAQARTA